MLTPTRIFRAVARGLAVAVGAALVAVAFFSALQSSLSIGW